MEKRICTYRNCNKELDESMRKDAIYCSRDCKTCEAKYRRRKKALLEKWKNKEMEKVNNIKEFIKIIQKGGQ